MLNIDNALLRDFFQIIGALSVICFLTVLIIGIAWAILPGHAAAGAALPDANTGNEWAICPVCGALNDDDWPVLHRPSGRVIHGACQMCWESTGGGFDSTDPTYSRPPRLLLKP